MAVIDNSSRPVFAIPGIRHQTLASIADQLNHVEVWLQTLEPGAASPVHYHECEEVVLILRGSGRLVLGEQAEEFGPGSTLIVASKIVHQLINTGSGELSLIAALSETPARVFAPDGSVVPVPWSGRLMTGSR